jgi:hypothetical protein
VVKGVKVDKESKMVKGPEITYHGRTGRPMVHTTKTGRKYIMVRKKGGGTQRLYEGSKYKENGTTKVLKL